MELEGGHPRSRGPALAPTGTAIAELVIRPDWIPNDATFAVEMHAGVDDLVLLIALCGRCGAELSREQTDVPRAPVAAAWDRGRLEPAEALARHAILRLPMRRCECGARVPGPRTAMRVEVPE